jgi:hypothetical protein
MEHVMTGQKARFHGLEDLARAITRLRSDGDARVESKDTRHDDTEEQE